ncbi:hypothetical protein, partial [Raoultella terrigena]|uniref:hypothetical protein n=1 Tax=Raoultella terrigena TaxID=577 RepID=UPI001C85E63A
FYLLFVGKRSPEEDKSAGSGFERCAATARRVEGRRPAINCQTSNKQRNLMRRHGVFLLSAVHEKGRTPPGSGAAIPDPSAAKTPKNASLLRPCSGEIWRQNAALSHHIAPYCQQLPAISPMHAAQRYIHDASCRLIAAFCPVRG